KGALDTNATAKAVDFVRKLYKEACIEDCIGWLDPHNNKAFLTSQISCTNNAYSIMVSAKRDLPEMGKVIDHALNPKGPNGQRYHALVPVTHGVFAYGPDSQAAKDFLRWTIDPKQFRPWIASGDMYFAPYLHAFDKVPEWDIEPRVTPYQKVLETGKLTTWPAPANGAHGAARNRWARLDMVATPPVLFLLAFLGYPFFYGVYLSFFRREAAGSASFVGLGNFVILGNDLIFWQAVRNTVLFTAVATMLKASGGLGMALVMNQSFRMKALTRASLLLPFIVPTVLSTVAWQWILDPGMGLFNRLLVVSGLAKTGPSWLGTPTMAMSSIIMVNTWRGLPFFGISILAALQTIPLELHESATIDGAGTW